MKKNCFKLMINSFYGKTVENVRLVNNKRDFLKYTSKPTHITYKIFDQNYAAIHDIKSVFYVGLFVLQLRRWFMYDFHYNFIKIHFDAEVLFTDTVSFTYEIKSADVFEEFFKHKYLCDFSNYPKDSKFFDQADKKVIGKVCWIKVKDVFHKKILMDS